MKLPAPLRLLGLHLPPIGYWDYERMDGTRRFQADPIAGNSWDRFSAGSYALVYSRTSTAFHDLEKRLGGDAFARAMKLYYERWHHRHPSTADLRQAIADGSGQPELVDGWFDQQVYANAPVDDRVVSVESTEEVPEPGMVEKEGKRVEKDQADVDREIAAAREAWKKGHPGAKEGDPGPYPFCSEVVVRRYEAHVPERLVVTFADGRRETLDVPVEERWHRYAFVGPARVTSAQLDPDGDVLLDLDKLDDGRTREPRGTASTRWALEASHAVQLLLSILVSQ